MNFVDSALTNPDELWLNLDSFWREETTPSTESLLKFQTYANLILLLNSYSKCQHFKNAQNINSLSPYWTLSWYPFIIYRSLIDNNEFITYADGHVYGTPPAPGTFHFGDSTPTQWHCSMAEDIVDLPIFYDSVTDSTAVLDAASFTFDAVRHKLIFNVDPFTVMPTKISLGGVEYITLWCRNMQMDLSVPFDWAGWWMQYRGVSSSAYVDTLKQLWKLILCGPNLEAYKRGSLASLELPYATAEEVVRDIFSDGYRRHVVTDTSIYSFKLALTAAVTVGTELASATPLSNGLSFYEYQQLLTVAASMLPALVLKVPLSTGTVANLIFANILTSWDFDITRPSPWRFPISGEALEVEQFWVDVDTYATTYGIDLATAFGLPAAVNPMIMIIEQLLKNKIFVTVIDSTAIGTTVQGFLGRVKSLLPADTLILTHQDFGSVSDNVDLGSVTSESVSYGYNVTANAEIVSVPGSGADLIFKDQTPLIVSY